MDWNRVEGNWKQFKGKVKEQWGKLTDDDLDRSPASAISSKAKSRNAMASRRIASAAMSMIGMADRIGRPNTSLNQGPPHLPKVRRAAR